ncbi:MAG: hypothetical protein RL670_1154 [Actinomycetota bacterium]
MSELLQLATALRNSSDDALLRSLQARRFHAGAQHDFFDLADALLASRSVQAALAGLPRAHAVALRELLAGGSIDETLACELAERFLVDQSGAAPFVYPSVAAVLGNLPQIGALAPVSEVPEESSARERASAAIAAQLAISEILYELQQRPMREVGKSSIALAEVKRLAAHLRQPNEYARQAYDLAQLAHLIVLHQGYWHPGATAAKWLAATPVERWRILANAVLAEIEPTTRNQFAQLRQLGHTSLATLFTLAFPFADSTVGGRVSGLQAAAELLALSTAGRLGRAFDEFLAGKVERLASELSPHLPEAADRLVCQADLTLIAPGPLTAKTERILRKFAEVEQVGLASTYRVTALSLSHGLETGIQPEAIEKLLVELSGRELPQPLSYLINEVAERFGRLTLTFDVAKHVSIVAANDSALLHEIENDSKLKHLALKQQSAKVLLSKLDADVIYNSMRSVGYTVIRTDLGGKVMSPEPANVAPAEVAATNPLLALIQHLRSAEENSRVDLGEDDLVRQIQLALKNKSQLELAVRSSSGEEVTFKLEPIGLANNRLRAKDRRADIERTLPLDKIVRVKITS